MFYYLEQMRELTLKGASGLCRIFIGDCSAKLKEVLSAGELILADLAVKERINALIPDRDDIVFLNGGEEIKSPETATWLYQHCFERQLQRSSRIVAVGGGTLCDLAGFVAATWLRGTKLTLVPTTLLSQVDASIGGKNGVNFNGVKNLIGVIRQPEECICDTGFLSTLPRELLSEGFSELIKHALIASRPLFEKLQSRTDPFDLSDMEAILEEAIRIKRDIVERDENESGERRKLNLGHTLGHAIEVASQIPHGHAVSIGTVLELQLSRDLGYLQESECLEISALFERYGLPIRCPAGLQLRDLVSRDKKRVGGYYSVPVLERIGSCVLVEISEENLLECVP